MAYTTLETTIMGDFGNSWLGGWCFRVPHRDDAPLVVDMFTWVHRGYQTISESQYQKSDVSPCFNSTYIRNDVWAQKVLPRCTQSESLVYVLGHYFNQQILWHMARSGQQISLHQKWIEPVRLIAFIFGWGLHCGKHTLIATGLAQSFLPPRNAAISKLEVLSLSFVSVFAPHRHQTCLELSSVVSHRILVRNGAFWVQDLVGSSCRIFQHGGQAQDLWNLPHSLS